MAFPSPCCPQKLPAATDHQTVTALAMTPLPHPLVLAQGNWVELDILEISFHWGNSCCLIRAYGWPAWSEERVKIPPATLWNAGKAPWPLPLNSHCTNTVAHTFSYPLILDEELRLELVLPGTEKCLKLADGCRFSYLNVSLLYLQVWRATFGSVPSG